MVTSETLGDGSYSKTVNIDVNSLCRTEEGAALDIKRCYNKTGNDKGRGETLWEKVQG